LLLVVVLAALVVIFAPQVLLKVVVDLDVDIHTEHLLEMVVAQVVLRAHLVVALADILVLGVRVAVVTAGHYTVARVAVAVAAAAVFGLVLAVFVHNLVAQVVA
jgi:hypothetical protein